MRNQMNIYNKMKKALFSFDTPMLKRAEVSDNTTPLSVHTGVDLHSNPWACMH